MEDSRSKKAGKAFAQQIEPEAFELIRRKLAASSVGLGLVANAHSAARKIVGEAFQPVLDSHNREIERAIAECSAKLSVAFEKVCAKWESEYGEPYPKEVDDWQRWAARVGWSGERITEGEWTPGDLFPIIEGYILRLRDESKATDAQPTAPPDGRPELPEVNLDLNQIRYGKNFCDTTSDGALLVGELVKAYPQSIAASALFPKPSRIKKSLPGWIQEMIIAEPAKGYRLKLPK